VEKELADLGETAPAGLLVAEKARVNKRDQITLPVPDHRTAPAGGGRGGRGDGFGRRTRLGGEKTKTLYWKRN